LGGYVSFSGIVTFKNAQEIQDVAKFVPDDRFLVETDAPYLAPVPHRGKPNQPAFVRHTAEKLAELRKVPFETIAEQSTANFKRLFSKAKFEK
jgi:TatD DNase family protein